MTEQNTEEDTMPDTKETEAVETEVQLSVLDVVDATFYILVEANSAQEAVTGSNAIAVVNNLDMLRSTFSHQARQARAEGDADKAEVISTWSEVTSSLWGVTYGMLMTVQSIPEDMVEVVMEPLQAVRDAM